MNNQVIKNEINPNNGVNKSIPSNEEVPIKNSANQNMIGLNQNNNSNNNKATKKVDFGSNPINTKCRFCKEHIETIVHKETGWGSICLSFWTLGIWYCIQKCQKKEINFINCRHKCPKCGQLINKIK